MVTQGKVDGAVTLPNPAEKYSMHERQGSGPGRCVHEKQKIQVGRTN